jgi:cytosine/adenosine deaminase-related metal-dependent hydrolase
LEDGQIPRRTLLVHVNEVSDEELPLLAGRTIAHCPKSHRYFGHPPFRWADLVAAGATVCLGTDSLASNDSLDLFSEIRVARSLHPEIRPDEILRAATVGGARALGREGLLGEIAEGAWADLIYLDNPDQGADPVEAAIEHRGPVSGVMVGGEPVYP